jgi:hypothetical protein
MQERLTRAVLIAAGALAWLAVGSGIVPAHAGSIEYFTPSGSTTGGQPVDASASFTTSTGILSITLTNLEANPTSVVQALSDLQFTLGNGGSLTGASLFTSVGQEITVNSNGTFTLGSAVATGWVPTLGGTSGALDVLGAGGAGPKHLIIGPPGAANTYSNANGSIAGNAPHNPFLNDFATFTIIGTGITADTTITSATFSFGTTEGANLVPGVAVPEPGSLALCAMGATSIFGFVVFRRWRRRLHGADA